MSELLSPCYGKQVKQVLGFRVLGVNIEYNKAVKRGAEKPEKQH